MFILYLLVVVLISLACFSGETHFFCNVFFVVFRTQKGGYNVPGILVETVETGIKNFCVIEATHVLQRKLRKD